MMAAFNEVKMICVGYIKGILTQKDIRNICLSGDI